MYKDGPNINSSKPNSVVSRTEFVKLTKIMKENAQWCLKDILGLPVFSLNACRYRFVILHKLYHSCIKMKSGCVCLDQWN